MKTYSQDLLDQSIKQDIAQCSTGLYYKSYNTYFDRVLNVLDLYGLTLEDPQIPNVNGSGQVAVRNDEETIGYLNYSFDYNPITRWKMIGNIVIY